MTSTATDIVELLAPYVRSFVGSSGGGRDSFQLLCSVPKCYRQDTVSASRRTIGREKDKLKACAKLAAQGWSIKVSPVCPDCRKTGETQPFVAADSMNGRPAEFRGHGHRRTTR